MLGKKPLLTFKSKREKFGIVRKGPKRNGPRVNFKLNSDGTIVRLPENNSPVFDKVKDINLKKSMTILRKKTFSQKKDIVIKAIKDTLKRACKSEEKYALLAKKMKKNKATASAIAEEIDARFSIARGKINPENQVKDSVIAQRSIAVSLKRAGFNHIEITKALTHINTSPLISVFILNDLLYTKVQIEEALSKAGYAEKDLEFGLMALNQIK